MKKLLYLMILTGSILCNKSMAQRPIEQESRKEITAEPKPGKMRMPPSGKPIKFRLSTMAAFNFSGARHHISGAVSSGFDQTVKTKSMTFKPCIDRYITPRFGAGISFNHFESKLNGERYVGSEDVTEGLGWFNGGWGVSNFGTGYLDYNDYVKIETSGNTLSAHAAYKLTQYKGDRRHLFEITARSGISVSFIREKQVLSVTQKKEYPVAGYYFETHNSFHTFHKTAGSVFMNLQLALHVTRYFSFILADLTQNFGIINPSIPQTSVTNSDGKTVSLGKHKTTASGFTLATGLAVSF